MTKPPKKRPVMSSSQYVLTPIGKVDVDESLGRFRLQIEERYRPALRGLGSCTHAIILWWADQLENPVEREADLIVELPYAPGVRTGVFANRSQARPNPISITTSFLIDVNEQAGTVDLAWIDAYDGTPVLDIKPYLPMSDRVRDAEYPEWLEGFPDSMEDAAAYFADPENAARFS
jgi:tRNA-Thr(GGU) m(6)t(6)A37 methyltransferase TsaA